MRGFFYNLLFRRRAPRPPEPPPWTPEQRAAFNAECDEVYRRGRCSMKTGHVISCRCAACERIYAMLVELGD